MRVLLALLMSGYAGSAPAACVNFFQVTYKSPFIGVERIFTLLDGNRISSEQAARMLREGYEAIGFQALRGKPYSPAELNYYGMHLRSMLFFDKEAKMAVEVFRRYEKEGAK